MQENLEATLAALVAIPSVTSDTRACQSIFKFIHDELKVHSLFIQTSTKVQNPWLIATTQDTKKPDILFYAHLDVVPGPSSLFQMQKQSDRLIGRGVFDMKLAAACYLEFLRIHANKLSSLNIGFLFTTDEEGGSPCMDEVIATGIHPNVTFIPDGGDNWTIEKRAKGCHAAELIASGTTAHGSRPWEGVSALHTLLDVLKPLREKYPFKAKHHPTLMINGIQSGHAINQIPDLATAQLDFRCFNQAEMEEYQDFLSKIIEQNNTVTLNVRHAANAIEFDETSPYVQSFLHTLRELRGAPPTFQDSYGASDARFFTPLDIPSIIIEPRGGGRHSNDEWLMADDLLQYYQLIEHWIMSDTPKLTTASQPHQAVLI